LSLEQITNFVAGMEWIWIIIIVGILVVVGIIALVISGTKKVLSSNKKEMNILKERLAKGEITKEEYHNFKKELK